ncbi:LytTR family DNA-binding domain-containing protein [Myroides ceti]|uniref:LytTR family DNA-binding domain-containing protein n=1 Tax=Paenimyroides ceti TaxID=395087 RepID=A0ABT8D197_9FLAO|nr:LytTR family DNA-binding domain-containing protein [Paenimyroides ceti]MDN3706712.1 LytTR family DNA-binding domain-containing protein [Paenimyroides ceti]MDN3709701.1 LytTR family DNA-binding domain-containing protein [Paenimyroides ceti]
MVVDDEPLAREGIISLSREIPHIDILGEFSNAVSALDFIKNNEVDLVFLDIQMPKVSGLEFAEQIPEQTLVIFTTAYSQYALRSYELEAIDYLLKPIERERLTKAVDKAMVYKKFLLPETLKNTVEGNSKEFILIKADRRYYKINFPDILFIEGLKDYVVIHTKEKKLITAMNIKTIHQKIDLPNFIRVSKSYIVNGNHIDSFDHQTIYLGENEIPIGDVYKKDFYLEYEKQILKANL